MLSWTARDLAYGPLVQKELAKVQPPKVSVQAVRINTLVRGVEPARLLLRWKGERLALWAQLLRAQSRMSQ